MLGADGRVAEQGPFSVLSANKEGAFTKLMEWQMSGGEVAGAPSVSNTRALGMEEGVESEGEGEEEEEREVVKVSKEGEKKN